MRSSLAACQIGWWELPGFSARSDMAWRSGDHATGADSLAGAVDNLDRMLQSDGSGIPFMDTLSLARFLLWQQEGWDPFSEGRFAQLEAGYDATDQSCSARANQVRQAILTGDESTARRVAAGLLESGYYEPGFIRVCTQYGVCQRGSG